MTVSEPSVCATCGGYGYLLRSLNSEVVMPEPCTDCRCVICGQHTAAIGGECGECWTDEDAAAVRRADL